MSKYDSPMAELLSRFLMDGICDDEIGSVDELGHFAGFSIDPEEAESIPDVGWANDMNDIGLDEVEPGWYILVGDDQGLVSCGRYDTVDDYNAAWSRIEAEYEKFYANPEEVWHAGS